VGHDNQNFTRVIHSLDSALQDLVNAIYLDLQAKSRVSPADQKLLDGILAQTKALLRQAQAISTVPPVPTKE